jgi:prepilin-type N-terminal cleavage/methylation domain-containing protein
MKPRAQSGFTLVEMMVVVGISSMILYTISTAVRASAGAYRTSSSSMNLEATGSRTIRRIVDELRGTDAALIAALPAPPFNAPTILFQDVEPFDGVTAAVSAPRTIAMVGDSVVRTESAGTADEVSVVWCDGVTSLLFAREGSSILVSLTLSNDDGTLTRTWSTTVTCRN